MSSQHHSHDTEHGHSHSHGGAGGHSHSHGPHTPTKPTAAAAAAAATAPATPAPVAVSSSAPSALVIPASPAPASIAMISPPIVAAPSQPAVAAAAAVPAGSAAVQSAPSGYAAALYDNLLAQLAGDDDRAAPLAAAPPTATPAKAGSLPSTDAKDPAAAAAGTGAAGAAAVANLQNTTDSAPVKRLLQQIRNSPPFKQHVDAHLTNEISKAFLVTLLGKYTASVLAREHLETISKFMKHQIDTVLTRIFRCHGNGNYGVSIFQNMRQARLFALRSALHKRYPLLASEGCASLSRAPVYYLSEGSPVFQSLDRYSWELLTSNHSFRVIPLKKTISSDLMPAAAAAAPTGADGKVAAAASSLVPDPTSLGALSTWSMDTDILEKEIEADHRAGRLPCAVLATFGGDITKFHSKTQMDDLDAIRKICDRHQLWLHAEGSSLLLAAATSAPSVFYSLFETADSVCASPLEWFDVESTTLGVTFLKTTDSHAPLLYHDLPVQLDDFPPLFLLWYQLVTHKVSHVSDLVDSHLHSARYFRQQLSKQLWPVKFGPGNYAASVTAASTTAAAATGASATTANGAAGAVAVTNTHPHLLFFQLQSTGTVPLAVFNLDRNVLNKYIWSRISARVRPEHALVSTIYHSQFGFLFHPLTNGSGTSTATATARPISTAAIDQLISDIGYELKLLDVAGTLREEFKAGISAQKELQYVPTSAIEHAFVGIGAFRLVPAFPIPVQQANALNVVLAHALAKNNPSLFAIAMTTADKLVCTVVRTSPLVLDKNCVTILIAEILDAAARLELPKEVVDQLSKVVQRGIREAEAKLQSTSTEAYYPTTLIRKLPVVGSVWNWFSPPVKPDEKQPAGWQLDIRSQELSKPKVSVAATAAAAGAASTASPSATSTTPPAAGAPAAAPAIATTTPAASATPAATPADAKSATPVAATVPAHGLLGASAATTPAAAATNGATPTATVPPATPAKPAVASTTTAAATAAAPAATTTVPPVTPAKAAVAPVPATATATATAPATGAAAAAAVVPTALPVPANHTSVLPHGAHAHGTTPAAGGLEILPPDKLIADVFYSVASAFHSKLKLPTDRATAIIGYAKQLVAGFNYFVIVQIDTNEFVHARIFSSFRSASGQQHTDLVGVRTGVKRDDPLHYF